MPVVRLISPEPMNPVKTRLAEALMYKKPGYISFIPRYKITAKKTSDRMIVLRFMELKKDWRWKLWGRCEFVERIQLVEKVID